jgi:hypothetical protein
MNDQQAGNSGSALQNKDPFYPCVEKGIWTPIPKAPHLGDIVYKQDTEKDPTIAPDPSGKEQSGDVQYLVL